MRKLLQHCLLFLSVASIPLTSAAQEFYLRTIDLKVKSFDLFSLQSITFENNVLVLKKTSGTTETYPIPSISALYFNSLYTAAPAIASESGKKISVYPNPAVSVIRLINFQQQEGAIIIFGSDGRILKRAMVTRENPEISLSGLSGGLYILKVDNQAIKLIVQ